MNVFVLDSYIPQAILFFWNKFTICVPFLGYSVFFGKYSGTRCVCCDCARLSQGENRVARNNTKEGCTKGVSITGDGLFENFPEARGYRWTTHTHTDPLRFSFLCFFSTFFRIFLNHVTGT